MNNETTANNADPGARSEIFIFTGDSGDWTELANALEQHGLIMCDWSEHGDHLTVTIHAAPPDWSQVARRYADALAGNPHAEAKGLADALRWFSQRITGGHRGIYAAEDFVKRFGADPYAQPEATE